MFSSLPSKVQDAAVEQSVSALLTALQNKVKLLGGVDEDFRKLESLQTMIQAVVKEADNQRLTEPQKNWRERLKKVAEEADLTKKDWQNNAYRRDTDNDDGSHSRFSLKKVRRLLSLAFSMISHFKLRHDIGWRINGIRESLDCLAKEARDLRIAVGNRERERVDKEARRQEIGKRETSSFVNKSSIVGRDGDIEKFMNLLLREGNEEANKVSVISIVGDGGVGKTTLAQLIYNEDRAKKFFEKRIWAFIAHDFDFDAKSVTKSILKSATERDHDSLNLEQLQQCLYKILSGKRFLLVLDDACNLDAEKWDKIYPALQDGAGGSRIIVTTCSEDVAWAMGSTPYRLQGLPGEVKKAIGSKRTRSEWESILKNETAGT